MKVEELMIGDWLLRNEKPVQVLSINSNSSCTVGFNNATK